MNDVELVGVVDIDTSQARQVADRYKTKAYTSHLDLLEHVDAVSIVVPTPSHFAVSKDFLAHDIVPQLSQIDHIVGSCYG